MTSEREFSDGCRRELAARLRTQVETLEEKAIRLETEAPLPRQASRDVSWSVVFRLDRTGVWVEWSNGHRDPSEAVREAEALMSNPGVADIRFERITRQREMFDLHGLAQLDDEETP